jgi:hypothetical protein
MLSRDMGVCTHVDTKEQTKLLKMPGRKYKIVNTMDKIILVLIH